jgi:hypothetical protein
LRIAERVHARLAAPVPSSRFSPVLLSALVWPGLGQLVKGEWAKGLAIVAGTLVAFGALAVRVWEEAMRRLPTDPAGFDLVQVFDMATSIRQDNAAFFTGVTAALVGLWAIAVADAWRGRR